MNPDVDLLAEGIDELLSGTDMDGQGVGGPPPDRPRKKRQTAAAAQPAPAPAGGPVLPPDVDFGEDPAEPPPGSPGRPVVAEPATPPVATSRAVPHKLRSVLQQTEYVRVMKVTGGKENYVEDYAVSDIAAAGDMTAFIAKYLAPTHGGGEYRVYEHTRTGTQRLVASISIAGPPAGSMALPPPGPGSAASGDTAAVFESTMKWQAWQAAKAKENEVSERMTRLEEMKLMMGMFRPEGENKGNGNGGSSMLETFLLMQMMGGMNQPPPPPPGPSMTDIMLMMQQQQPPPPPLPPPPPPEAPRTDWAAVATIVIGGVGSLVTPIVSAILSRPAPPDLLTQLPSVLVVAKDLGLLGGEKLTHADLVAHETKVKLDMMLNQPPEDPIEQMTKFAGLLAQLQPKNATPRDWFDVTEKAIDRLPDVINAIKAAVFDGNDAKALMVAGANGKTVPAALLQLVDDVNKQDMSAPNAGPEVVLLVLNSMQEIGGAGGNWSRMVKKLIEAVVQPSTAAAKAALNELFSAAFNPKDGKARSAFSRIVSSYEPLSDDVARIMREKMGMPAGAARDRKLNVSGAAGFLADEPAVAAKAADKAEVKAEAASHANEEQSLPPDVDFDGDDPAPDEAEGDPDALGDPEEQDGGDGDDDDIFT